MHCVQVMKAKDLAFRLHRLIGIQVFLPVEASKQKKVLASFGVHGGNESGDEEAATTTLSLLCELWR